jgi:chaperonin GroES
MLRPLFNRIIVNPISNDERTPGGLFVPDRAKEKPSKGIVLAVGNGKPNKDGTFTPLQVEVGDTVLYGKYAGTELVVDNEKCVIMTEDEVMGVVT